MRGEKFWIIGEYQLIQCTWGLVQTLLGLVVFLWFWRSPHEMYHGAVHTRWELDGGISLGLFIFTPDRDEDWCQRMAVHEYGHTWQSLMLGPLYLAAVGIPSIIWARFPVFVRRRREKNLPYSAFYTERWADALGDKMVSQVRGLEEGGKDGHL